MATGFVLRAIALLFVPLAMIGSALAAAPMATRQLTFIDESRPVKASMGFAGSPTRRIDVRVWQPAGSGPFPLVIYSHGTFGSADNAMHIVAHLVAHGYIVAAPDFPLSSRAAYTQIKFADPTDVFNQTRDIRFIIDRLLADPAIGPAIDPGKIGTTGHSLGAVTSYFTSFGAQTRDPRIAATALINFALSERFVFRPAR